MALPFFLINCASEKRGQKELNDKLIEQSNIPTDLLSANVLEYEESTAHAVLQIECDYSRLGEREYINAIYKFEDVLSRGGIKSISYRLIDKGNKGGALYAQQNNLGTVLSKGHEHEGRKKQIQVHEEGLEEQLKEYGEREGEREDGGREYRERQYKEREYKEQKKKSKKVERNIILKGKPGLSKDASYMQIKGQFVKLRQKPKVGSKIKAYLFDKTVVKLRWKSNIKFKIKSSKDYWYKISTANKAGWVYGKYLVKTKSRRASSYLTNNKIYLKFMNAKPKLLRGLKGEDPYGSTGRVEIGVTSLEYITKANRYKIHFAIVGEAIRWGKVEVAPRKGVKRVVKKGLKSRANPNESYIKARIWKETKETRKTKETNKVDKINKVKKAKDVEVMRLYNGGSASPSEWWITGRVDEDFDWENVINKGGGGEAKADKAAKAAKELNSLSIRKARGAQMESLSYKGQSDYNLILEMNEYVKNRLTAGDYKLAQVLLKLIELDLRARGEKAQSVTKGKAKNPRFHTKFNSYYDTIKLSLESIDFDNKKVLIKVKRTSPNFGGEANEIVKDKLYLDFKHIRKYKKQDYDKYDEIYYSEVVHALNSLGVSGYDKKELVALAKRFVKLLLRQEYI